MPVSEKTISPPARPAQLREVINSADALTEDLVARVTRICDQVEDGVGEACVVLHIQGAAGDEGGGDWPSLVSLRLVNKWERALRRLEQSSAAAIATVSGYCSGLALDVLLATDYRIATADALLAPPVTSGRLWPGMAVHRLAHQVGVAKARRLVLFGRELTAADGIELGLFDEVVPDHEGLADAVASASGLLAGTVRTELAVRRRLLLEAVSTGFEESLGSHLAACDRLLRHQLDESTSLGNGAQRPEGASMVPAR
jgi:isomerase DpgB